MEFVEAEKVDMRKGEVNHNENVDSDGLSSYDSEQEEREEEHDESDRSEAEYEDEAEEETYEGYPDASPAVHPASSLNFFNNYLDSTAMRFPISSPTSDVKITVMGQSVGQPAFSTSKSKGSLFSLSSLHDVCGNGRIPRAGQMKVMDALLRSAAAVCSLVAFCVMSSTREMRSGAGSTFEVKFSDFQAYSYLVAANVLAFVYSSAQVVMVLQSANRKSNQGSVFTSLVQSGVFKYLCDEIVALCLFSASSSAATAARLSHQGLENIWPPACSTWKLWAVCSKADAAVAISFFSSFFVILSSVLSGFTLLHLIVQA